VCGVVAQTRQKIQDSPFGLWGGLSRDRLVLFYLDINRSNKNLSLSSNLNSILTNAASLKKAVQRLMGLNILLQFYLAHKLLWDNIGSVMIRPRLLRNRWPVHHELVFTLARRALLFSSL
jgi:hypothetical protein